MKAYNLLMGFTVVISVALSVGLFILLPYLIANLLKLS